MSSCQFGLQIINILEHDDFFCATATPAGGKGLFGIAAKKSRHENEDHCDSLRCWLTFYLWTKIAQSVATCWLELCCTLQSVWRYFKGNSKTVFQTIWCESAAIIQLNFGSHRHAGRRENVWPHHVHTHNTSQRFERERKEYPSLLTCRQGQSDRWEEDNGRKESAAERIEIDRLQFTSKKRGEEWMEPEEVSDVLEILTRRDDRFQYLDR